MSVLIKNALVLRDADAELVSADVRISGRDVEQVGPQLSGDGVSRIIDGTGRLVMPGLVNAHLHSSEAFFKGRYDRLTFDAWGLFAYPVLDSAPLSKELIRLRTLLVAIESLKNGVTCVVDDVADQISGQRIDALATVFSAYREAGIRATCSGNVMDRAYVDTLPFIDETLTEEQRRRISGGNVPTVEEYIAFSEEAVGRFHRPDDGQQYMVAPVSPQWCTDSMLQAASRFAIEHSLAIHTHVLETRSQVATTEQHFGGRSLVQRLDELGALGPRTTVIHAVWVTEDDIRLLAERGCSVVHNPVTNLKLGAGIAPIPSMLEAGINVALGTDGLACNDSARMFDAMRVAALVQRVKSPDPSRWLSARDTFRAATLGGARSCGLSDSVGSVEEGKRADLVILDVRTPSFTPLNDPVSHLVHSENGASVEYVIVDGRVVLDGGRVTTLDEAEVLREIRETIGSYLEEHGRVESRHREFEEAYTEIDIRSDFGEI